MSEPFFSVSNPSLQSYHKHYRLGGGGGGGIARGPPMLPNIPGGGGGGPIIWGGGGGGNIGGGGGREPRIAGEGAGGGRKEGLGSLRNENCKKNCLVSLFQWVQNFVSPLSTSLLGTWRRNWESYINNGPNQVNSKFELDDFAILMTRDRHHSEICRLLLSSNQKKRWHKKDFFFLSERNQNWNVN